MHSMLMSDKATLMGADMIGDEGYKPGNTISLCLVCESKEEIETLFSKLARGGRVKNPLKKEFFGVYGDLTDRYGFGWMFQFGGNQQT
jgi:PhnB protein